VAASVYLIWRLFFATPAVPPNIVALSGRIEGDDSAISPKTGGRILDIRFREGDSVKAGEVIAILSDEQIRDRAAGAYDKYQKCGLHGARRLLVSGW